LLQEVNRKLKVGSLMKMMASVNVLLLVTVVASIIACQGGWGMLAEKNLPAIEQLPLHRQTTCEKCGDSERLGVLFDQGDVKNLDASGAKALVDAVLAYGVVVIPGQNLSRADQVRFTAKLGEVVVLPKFFGGNDPEPSHPAIQRITNFWTNGTWKGPYHHFGDYWHQDGDFWTRPKHHVISVLHAQNTPAHQGETGFADLRAAFATLSMRLKKHVGNASIKVSVRDIPDFKNGSPEDLAKFPNTYHPVVDRHPVDNGTLLYLGSIQAQVEGLEPESSGKRLLSRLMTHATEKTFTYYHKWEAGDIVLWDNVQTLHCSLPYNNDGSAKRELYRTQAWPEEAP